MTGDLNRKIRKLRNNVMLSLTGVATLLVLLPLALILFYVVKEGVSAISPGFFVHLPEPPDVPGGGMANAIVGTLELLLVAVIVGVPLGIAAGIYVAEHGAEFLTKLVRFSADVLNGTPTIVTGLFIYGLVVLPMRKFSTLAGGLALAIILLPVVLRTTDEVLQTIPRSYREAALALGATRFRVLWDVVLRAARAGIMGGVLLAISRVAGETAPLLFTSFNNSYWSMWLDRPVASLTVQIFNYAIAPYDRWHAQAWAGALTLITMIIVINLGARAWLRWRTGRLA